LFDIEVLYVTVV